MTLEKPFTTSDVFVILRIKTVNVSILPLFVYQTLVTVLALFASGRANVAGYRWKINPKYLLIDSNVNLTYLSAPENHSGKIDVEVD